MGEKGNLETGGAVGALATSGLVERTTTTIVSSVSDTGTQLADSIRDAGIEAIANQTVAEGRARLAKESGDAPPPITGA